MSGILSSPTMQGALSQPLPMDGRATFLPFMDSVPGSVMNERSWAVPGVLASLWNAFTAPGRAYSGQLDPMSPQGMEEGANFAGAMLGSGTTFGALGAQTPRGVLGMNVYHGSPHKFDKFDASKIGTGEGAQAYGYGLYFAENPSVASMYKDAGTLKGALNFGDDANTLASKALSQSSGDKEKAIALLKELEVRTPWGDRRSVLDAIRSVGNSDVSRHLYTVDLPDSEIAKMLDWDKPLSQQPEIVKQFVAKNNYLAPRQGEATMGEAFARVRKEGDPEMELADFGIPGIRYLDQASRAGGQGTSNFVVFPGNEGILSILKRE